MTNEERYPKLRRIFEKVWCEATAYPGTSKYGDPTVLSFGQCAVTALVIHHLYGGDIVYNDVYHHYWNILPDGSHLDLTRDQFGNVIHDLDEYRVVDPVMLVEHPRGKKHRTGERFKELYADFINVLESRLI